MRCEAMRGGRLWDEKPSASCMSYVATTKTLYTGLHTTYRCCCIHVYLGIALGTAQSSLAEGDPHATRCQGSGTILWFCPPSRMVISSRSSRRVGREHRLKKLFCWAWRTGRNPPG